MTALTPSQRLVLLAIAYRRERLGWCPSYRQVLETTGVSSKSVLSRHVHALRSRGLVGWLPNAERTLHLTAAGKEALS